MKLLQGRRRKRENSVGGLFCANARTTTLTLALDLLNTTPTKYPSCPREHNETYPLRVRTSSRWTQPIKCVVSVDTIYQPCHLNGHPVYIPGFLKGNVAVVGHHTQAAPSNTELVTERPRFWRSSRTKHDTLDRLLSGVTVASIRQD